MTVVARGGVVEAALAEAPALPPRDGAARDTVARRRDSRATGATLSATGHDQIWDGLSCRRDGVGRVFFATVRAPAARARPLIQSPPRYAADTCVKMVARR